MWSFETLGKFREERIKGEIITFNDLIKEELVDNQGDELHCWLIRKNKKFYLLENQYLKELPIKINQIQLNKDGKNIRYFISDFDALSFEAKKHYSFREFVDRFYDVEHSNTKHFRLIKLIAIACHLSRINARICAPIEFGKDGTFEVLGFLNNSVVVLDEPESLPRVKSAMNSSVLVLNEIVATGEFAGIFKKIYLSLGSRKPQYYPPRLGKSGSATPVDVRNLSFVTCYNLLNEVSEKDKENYFDFVFGRNVTSRYIPFKFSGKINMTSFRNPPPYTLEIDNELLKMARTLQYYKENPKKELKPYHVDLSSLPLSDRQKDSFLKIVDCINLDSETEQEFKDTVNDLLECHYAYKRMLSSSNMLTDYGNEQKPEFSNSNEQDKVEVMEIVDDSKSNQQQHEKLTPIKAIEELDKGEGAFVEEIAEKLNITVGELHPQLLRLSEKGDIFENIPSRWKVLN